MILTYNGRFVLCCPAHDNGNIRAKDSHGNIYIFRYHWAVLDDILAKNIFKIFNGLHSQDHIQLASCLGAVKLALGVTHLILFHGRHTEVVGHSHKRAASLLSGLGC